MSVSGEVMGEEEKQAGGRWGIRREGHWRRMRAALYDPARGRRCWEAPGADGEAGRRAGKGMDTEDGERTERRGEYEEGSEAPIRRDRKGDRITGKQTQCFRTPPSRWSFPVSLHTRPLKAVLVVMEAFSVSSET